jgi:hypothetical protein
MPCAITATRACGPRKAQGSRVYSYLGMWPGNSLGAGRPALTPNVGSRKGWLDRPRAVGPAFAGWARKRRSARSMPGCAGAQAGQQVEDGALTTGGEIPGGASPAAPERGRVVANRKFEREGAIAQSAAGHQNAPAPTLEGLVRGRSVRPSCPALGGCGKDSPNIRPII